MAKKNTLVKDPPAPPYHMLKPFWWSLAASLLYVAPQEVPKPSMAAVKVLPILCLVWVVLRKEALRKETIMILVALGFSLAGDYYLVWPKIHFMEGILTFWVTQLIYIFSFGFKRVSWRSGVAVYGFNLLLLPFALNFIPSPPEKIAAAFYSFTIHTMVWRAIDRALLDKDVSWHRRVFGAAGAMTFVVSDLCIAVLQEGNNLPHLPTQLIILSTYYLAQVLIVLGLCEGFWKQK